MSTVFVDANAWIALNHRRDQFHKNAIKQNRQLLKNGSRYITTNYVLSESYTWLLRRVGHFAAVEFGESIRKSEVTMLVHVTEEIDNEAWEIFKRYSDKTFSFVDCTSFVVMRHYDVTQVFTNDHHFVQMGFETLL